MPCPVRWAREREREGKGKQHMKGWGANGCEGNRIKHSPVRVGGVRGLEEKSVAQARVLLCCVVVRLPFSSCVCDARKRKRGRGRERVRGLFFIAAFCRFF